MKRLALSLSVVMLTLAMLVSAQGPAQAASPMLWVEIGDQLDDWFIQQKGECKHGRYEKHQWRSVVMYGNPITGPGPSCTIRISHKEEYEKHAIYDVGIRYVINSTPWYHYKGGSVELDTPVVKKNTLGNEGGSITFHRVKPQ